MYTTPSDFQFYPTPRALVSKLVSPYYSSYTSVLEPSAGRGDIVDYLSKERMQISVCELSADLRAILTSKGYNVIGTDFLALTAPYQFGLILMNPPFAKGAEHVLKAWDMLLPGGDLAAILPESVTRRTIGLYPRLNQLIDLFGEVESVGSAFAQGERRTDEPCIIVRLKKPEAKTFNPFEHFTPSEDAAYTAPDERDLPAPRDLVRAIVSQYTAAQRALKVASDAESVFRSLVPASVIKHEEQRLYAERVDRVKVAFWDLVFERTKIGEMTTSNYQKKFMEERAKLSRMEFSEETIYEVLHRYMQNKDKILEECVMAVFDVATRYSRDNAVQHERWATNKGWKINSKIIIPNAVSVYGWHVDYDDVYFLNDLDKVLSMFGGTNGVCTAKAADEFMKGIGHGTVYDTKFETPNFSIRVFKKRTMHLWFKDSKALDLINQYAAERHLFTLGSGK